MGVEVNAIRYHFPDANAIADAWFTRASDRMLAPMPEGFYGRPVPDRIRFLMQRWFEALSPYRRVAADILAEKSHWPHVHHWVPAIFHLSRLIQLMRDAAGLHARGRRSQIEEIGMTDLFLATLWIWCRDESDNQEQHLAVPGPLAGQGRPECAAVLPIAGHLILIQGNPFQTDIGSGFHSRFR